jgi:hypothetical protein
VNMQPNKPKHGGSTPRPILLHRMRRFLVTFDNKKYHGMHPIQSHTAEGCVSTNGEVAIFTEHFNRRGFRSISEMCSALEEYGSCSISWVPDNGLTALSPVTRQLLSQFIVEAFQTGQVQDTLMRFVVPPGEMKDAINELKQLMGELQERPS